MLERDVYSSGKIYILKLAVGQMNSQFARRQQPVTYSGPEAFGMDSQV
jgi:hypothetical protein